MIFVSVGTAHKGFDRLVRAVDVLAASREFNFVVQRGHTRYTPGYCRSFDFLPQSEFLNYLRESDVVICHGGYMIISECLANKKRIIVVPRTQDRDEAVNDQNELAHYLEQRGLITIIENVDELRNALLQNYEVLKNDQLVSRIPDLVKEFVLRTLQNRF